MQRRIHAGSGIRIGQTTSCSRVGQHYRQVFTASVEYNDCIAQAIQSRVG
jgi:hypothetical protein